jgi:hypothetical protein
MMLIWNYKRHRASGIGHQGKSIKSMPYSCHLSPDANT